MIDTYSDWTIDDLIEIEMSSETSFRNIKETLTRIGVASALNKTLTQSCHILQKGGRFYIVHFKEMFAIDGRENRIKTADILRRNSIVKMLIDWQLCRLVGDNEQIEDSEFHKNIYRIKYDDKHNWELKSKYTMGVRT